MLETVDWHFLKIIIHSLLLPRTHSLSPSLEARILLVTRRFTDVSTSGELPKVILFFGGRKLSRIITFFNFSLLVENDAHCDFKKLRSLLLR